jgi:rhodanese-related sulfurtransferase
MQKYNLEDLIKEKKGTVVDVRTPAEFMGAHVINSINIPLNEIPSNMDKIKELQAPVILCCASGGRSAQAEQYLLLFGVDCINAGSWTNVNFYKNSFA